MLNGRAATVHGGAVKPAVLHSGCWVLSLTQQYTTEFEPWIFYTAVEYAAARPLRIAVYYRVVPVHYYGMEMIQVTSCTSSECTSCH